MFHTFRHPAALIKLATFVKDDDRGVLLSFSMTMPSLVLEQFAPGLLGALFRAADVISTQAGATDLVPRFPLLKSAPWSATIVGATVEIQRDDLFGQEAVRLDGCDVDGFVLHPQDDGQVEVACRVRARPDEAEVGQVYAWVDKTVLVTITPPEHATYEPAAAADDDDDQGDMLADADDDDLEGDDPDTIPVTAPAKRGRKPGKKPAAKKRTARAYPAALDGTGDVDPFGVPGGSALQ